VNVKLLINRGACTLNYLLVEVRKPCHPDDPKLEIGLIRDSITVKKGLNYLSVEVRER
jgi:predicted phosphoribosyltransferase